MGAPMHVQILLPIATPTKSYTLVLTRFLQLDWLQPIWRYMYGPHEDVAQHGMGIELEGGLAPRLGDEDGQLLHGLTNGHRTPKTPPSPQQQ